MLPPGDVSAQCLVRNVVTTRRLFLRTLPQSSLQLFAGERSIKVAAGVMWCLPGFTDATHATTNTGMMPPIKGLSTQEVCFLKMLTPTRCSQFDQNAVLARRTTRWKWLRAARKLESSSGKRLRWRHAALRATIASKQSSFHHDGCRCAFARRHLYRPGSASHTIFKKSRYDTSSCCLLTSVDM